MDYIEPHSRIYVKAILALFLGSFVTFADLYSTQPLIPTLSEQFHVSPAVGSLSLSVTTGALAVFMLISPAISDSIGRKPIMTVSLMLSSVLLILAAFTPNFTLLLVIRALQGIFLAGFPSIAMGYINEEFHPNASGLVMGIYVSGTSVGGMAGRFIMGALTDLYSWHVGLAVLGAISLLVSFLFWRILPDSLHFTPRQGSVKKILSEMFHVLKNPVLLSLYGIGFILMGGFVTLYNYIGYPLMAPPYNLSQTIVGFIFILYLTGTFSSTWMGKLADGARWQKVLGTGIIIMFVGALITLNELLYLKIIGLAVFTFGFFGSHSVASGWVGKSADAHNKAQSSSLYLLFYYTGSSLVGATGGLFWSHSGWGGVIFFIESLLILALFLLLLIPFIRGKIINSHTVNYR